MVETFGMYATRLLDDGYHPLPIKPTTKRPALRSWSQWCSKAPEPRHIDAWARFHPRAGIGFACGRVIGIDIDIETEVEAHRIEQLARNILGDTPLKRIGRAPRRLLVYRATTPFKGTKRAPIEVLALGQQFVGFGIHPDTKRPYVWPDQSPLDTHVDALPMITEVQAHEFIAAALELLGITAPQTTAASLSIGCQSKFQAGERNGKLAREIRTAAMAASSLDELIAQALVMNADRCDPPLPEAEVRASCKTAWGYKSNGKLLLPGAEPSIITTRSEILRGFRDPDAFVFASYVRAEHEARAEPFALAEKALAKKVGWHNRRIRRVKKALVSTGLLNLTHKGGRGAGDPDRFRLNPAAVQHARKGAGMAPNTTKHVGGFSERVSLEAVAATSAPPINMDRVVLPAAAQGDLFGNAVVVNLVAIRSWSGGKVPAELVQAVRHELRRRGLRQDDLAEHIGLSRPQTTNALVGRFGVNPLAAERIKLFVIEGALSARSAA